MSSGHPRVGCCVEGCHRGTTTIAPLEEGFYNLETGSRTLEFICSVHWRRVPRLLKRRRRLLFRQWERVRRRSGKESFVQLKPGSVDRIRWVRVEHLVRATWKRCKLLATPGADVPGGTELPAGLSEELRRAGL